VLVQGLANTEAGGLASSVFYGKLMNQKGGMCQSIVLIEQPFIPLHKSDLFLFIASLSFHHLELAMLGWFW